MRRRCTCQRGESGGAITETRCSENTGAVSWQRRERYLRPFPAKHTETAEMAPVSGQLVFYLPNYGRKKVSCWGYSLKREKIFTTHVTVSGKHNRLNQQGSISCGKLSSVAAAAASRSAEYDAKPARTPVNTNLTC